VQDHTQGRKLIMKRILDELSRGGSVMWVFPLVNESEHFEGMGSANQVSRRLARFVHDRSCPSPFPCTLRSVAPLTNLPGSHKPAAQRAACAHPAAALCACGIQP
jgi:hypothetical protein